MRRPVLTEIAPQKTKKAFSCPQTPIYSCLYLNKKACRVTFLIKFCSTRQLGPGGYYDYGYGYGHKRSHNVGPYGEEEEVEESPYESREQLARDVVRVLREELHHLLARGAALVQFDEPVLTEVVFSGTKKKRSFMCGALSEKGDPEVELDFAVSLLNTN